MDKKKLMLRTLRIILALLFFAGVTLLLAGVMLPLGWMAKLQLLPAILAGNVIVVVLLVVLTLLLGRVYCSVICPLGVLQDGFAHAGAAFRKRGKRPGGPYRYRKELKWLRDGVWMLTVAALIAGAQIAVAFIAPYSAYGRIVRSVVDPVWPVALVAGLTLALVGTLAFLFGRQGWCNSVCPVGTTLGLLSNFQLFGPVIDKEKCKHCKLCEHACKASCIDIANKRIDYSRCVSCYDCLDSCRFDALHFGYTWPRRKTSGSVPCVPKTGTQGTAEAAQAPDNGRRAFLTGTALLAGGGLLKAQKKVDGGFASVLDKTVPEREVPLTPPGSKSVKDFYAHCTACQLCVAACPNGVLRPSTDLGRLMQPEMGYEKGFCRPECTKCSELCPTGAILPVSREEKTRYHIGTARIARSLCVAERGVRCDNCAHHCPSGAIRMVENEEGHPVPVVNEALCTGCGACEFLCPARPVSAITVNGKHSHLEQ